MKPTPLSDPRFAAAKEEENLHIDLSFHPDIVSDSDGLDAQDGEELPTKRNWAEYLPLVSLIACVIAVLMDPLFFFIPLINEDHVCIEIDEALMITALTSRMLTDTTFLVRTIYQVRGAVLASLKSREQIDRSCSVCFKRTKAIAKDLCRSLAIDILASLPVPQVVIVYLFFKSQSRIRDSSMILNFMLLVQYLPRMHWIFVLSRKLRKNSALWFKGAFYFFMYIVASYVLGGFYYFNTVQRKVTCWQEVTLHRSYLDCLLKEHKDAAACSVLYHYTCDGHRRSYDSLTADVQQYCNSTSATSDATSHKPYGIFTRGLTSKVMSMKYSSKKLLFVIWWGLRNLSNFGTGLDTSPSEWESYFGIIVCTIGLILFAYLIGNMQECMQSAEEKKAAIDKVQEKTRDLLEWMDKNHISEKLRKEIMQHIKQKLEVDKDADLENLFSLLPWNSVKSMKPILCISMLTKVPGLQNMDARGLKMICRFLKPVIYSEKTILSGVGEPLDSMIFIVEGIVLIYSTGSDNTHQDAGKEITVRSPPMIHGSLEKGDVYGDEQLLSWASSTDVPVYTTLPISTKTVRCLTKVECFVLIANDLKTVVSSYKLNLNPSSSGNDNVRSTNGSGGTSMIRRIPTARD